MRTLICLLSAASLIALAGCGDSVPLSSTNDEALAAPAEKLTLSSTQAGGYKRGMLKLTGAGHIANAATNIGPSGGCPVGWTKRDMAGTGNVTVLGNYTIEQSHCAAPNRLSFTRGEFVFTSEPGDALFGTYRGTISIVDGLRARVAARITGGTGRFEGASGYLYQTGILTPGEGEGGNSIDGSNDGWIRLPGSRPMTGNFLGQVVTDEDPANISRCAGDLARILDVRGESNVTGPYTVIGRHCFVLADILSFKPGGTIEMVKGDGAFVTADGDELQGTYGGLYYPTDATLAEGRLTMTFTWTGGTGRFAGASGTLIGSGYSAPGVDALSASYKGGIATAAGN